MKQMKYVSFGEHGYFEIPKHDSGMLTGVQSIGNSLFVFTSNGVYEIKWPQPWYKKIVARIRGWWIGK